MSSGQIRVGVSISLSSPTLDTQRLRSLADETLRRILGWPPSRVPTELADPRGGRPSNLPAFLSPRRFRPDFPSASEVSTPSLLYGCHRGPPRLRGSDAAGGGPGFSPGPFPAPRLARGRPVRRPPPPSGGFPTPEREAGWSADVEPTPSPCANAAPAARRASPMPPTTKPSWASGAGPLRPSAGRCGPPPDAELSHRRGIPVVCE